MAIYNPATSSDRSSDIPRFLRVGNGSDKY